MIDKSKRNDAIALVLTIIAWFWTAHECNTIGIDVFDMLLKRFPGQLWIMAAILSYLTFIWMRPHLITRAVMALFMLAPAEIFPYTRLHVPESGFAPIQILVAFVYLLAIIGMYGMFYPWNIEKALVRLGLMKGPVDEPGMPGEKSDAREGNAT